MVTRAEARFAGYACIKLESQALALWLTRSVGPRILGECYGNPHFLELETLDPRTTLEPGSSVSHRETWTVHASASIEDLPDLLGESRA
jgi:hypothetical protein